MKKRYNLTKGNILKQLIIVSLPVIATSLVQMAYNMTDLFWLGQIKGDDLAAGAVASAGTAGFFPWLGVALMLLVRIGTEVRVSQSYGREDFETAKHYAKTGIQLEFIFAFIYSIILFVFANPFTYLFNIDDINVYNNAVSYLRILSFGMLFYLINPVFAGSSNGTGNTILPFLISFIGLSLNMVLDPIFIFVLDLGVLGAAYATVLAQLTVTVIFVLYYTRPGTILHKVNYFSKINKAKAADILKLGRPVALQSALFTLIAMYMGSIVFGVGGTNGSAVHKIGSQIEALSWLTAGGVQTALSAFVGQNFGANKFGRVTKGVRYALIAMTSYGIFISLLLFFAAGPLFSIFMKSDQVLPLGIDYLKILAFSQLFMIIESLIGGAFNGLGKTTPSSIVSITFNLARIPMAFIFTELYGINGIWLAITISSIFKGLVIFIWFKFYIRKREEFKNPHLSYE